MIRPTRMAAGAALLTISVAVAACGGAATSPGAAAVPSIAAPSIAVPSIALPSLDIDPNASFPIALPSFDLSELVKNLDGVDSYKVVVTRGGQPAYTSTVVTKPVLSRDATMINNGQESRIVVIGDEAWMGQGDQLTPTPGGGLVTQMLSLFDPALLVGAFAAPGALAGATDQGTEEKNGVQAKHYHLDAGSYAGLASMPPGSAFDIWISEDGMLVSIAMQGFGNDFVMDVTNVNDPANKVERPG